ncbi:MAG: TrpB-like pyridoxal phosphate-dependent enzyme [Thermosphaera sp.]
MEIKSRRDEFLIPSRWYNIVPDLPEPLPPPILPNGQPVDEKMLSQIFPVELARQEFATETYISIPSEIIDLYSQLGRPTPLIRARNLESVLKTNAKIYFKYEGILPTGSHKINTALAQAYYNKNEGVEILCTETGAGQWGSALSLAGKMFGLKTIVFMVRASYIQKPFRRVLMEMYGGEVHPSPSTLTSVGRKYLSENPEHPGSLGIAISEAIEYVVSSSSKAKYSLGSVLNHVLLHQTVIGLEALNQLEDLGMGPEDVSYVIGAVGGGSNFAGLSYPFIRYRLKGKTNTNFIAVEPRAVPSMTNGSYKYDFGDSAGLTPMLKMHTLGHEYIPPPIHAGGLRYHGVAPTLSILIKHSVVKPIAYSQHEVFEAGRLFATTQGFVPAPESAHAVKAVIDIARKYVNSEERPVILFNLSGHGLLDLSGYSDFINGLLQNV